VNDELERICKEADVAYFKVISRHLSGRTEVNHENLSPGRYLNLGPPEFEARSWTVSAYVKDEKCTCKCSVRDDRRIILKTILKK
jgi:hypothetical protein